MSRYGEILDSSIDLNKINVYNFFSEYFNNPELVKIKEVNNMAMFGTRVKSSLLRDRKYIFALVDLRDPSSRLMKASLSDLQWSSLQTRNIEDVYSVTTCNYVVNKDFENKEIKLVKINDSKTMYYYTCPSLPSLLVTLLCSKNQTRNYSERGTLNLAIESYNCIISFN